MKYLLVFFLLLHAEVGFTSKEGVLITDSFQMDSSGIGTSGPVTVKGKRNSKGKFDSVSVNAFGKKLSIAKNLLDKIPHNTNGIQITYENGYERIGGRTVYIIFMAGFTSNQTEKVILSVNEQGKSDLVQ